MEKNRVAAVSGVPHDRIELPEHCYNAGPTFPLPCIYTAPDSGRSVVPMVWGLQPRFKTETHLTTNNARTESVVTSKLYSRVLGQRCVLVVNGFYEWKAEGSHKRPFYITNPATVQGAVPEDPPDVLQSNQTPMLMAGLYDLIGGKFSFTVLTLASVGKMAEVHDRMPLFISSDDLSSWLDTSTSYESISDSLQARARDVAADLNLLEVSSMVNSIKSQSADCILPKKVADEKQFSTGIGRFFAKRQKLEYLEICVQPRC